MNLAALIPARGGSKGIPKKNLRRLGDHPLLAYSIAAARACPAIDRVMVSTDSPEIAEVARAYGADIPFVRPAEFAQDASTDFDVVQHVLQSLQQARPDWIVFCRPTTPLRDPSLLSAAIELLKSRKDATSLRSVHELAEPPQKMMGMTDGLLTGLFPHETRSEYYNLPRQAFPPAYHPNGYVDIMRSEVVLHQRALYGPRVLAFVTPIVTEVDRQEDLDYLAYQLAQHPSPLSRLLDAEQSVAGRRG